MRVKAFDERRLGVRLREAGARAERRQDGADLVVVQAERAEPRHDLADAHVRVALGHAAEYLQHALNARERELGAARQARREVPADVVAALAEPALDLEEQARLADAVVAAHRERRWRCGASRTRAPRRRRAARRGGRRSARTPRSCRAPP